MMEYALEEDIPDEFKGGTLAIKDDDNSSLKEETCIKNETKKEGTASFVTWKEEFVAPITNKITETLKRRASSTTGKLDNALQALATRNADSATDYFTFREGIIDNAIRDCTGELMDEEDGKLVAKFLLTEINLWDSDKERLVLLTEKNIIAVKYDFIALKHLEHRRIPLEGLDSIVIGDLVYPSGSLVPRLNGLADGLTSIMQTCLFAGWAKNNGKVFETFQSRDRKCKGLRLMWNRGQPLGFSARWNPFNNDVPLCTFTAHPLFFHEDCSELQRKLYDLNEFTDRLREVLASLKSPDTLIHHKNIVLQNYVGLGSMIHNRNCLGFFKVRGRFSF